MVTLIIIKAIGRKHQHQDIIVYHQHPDIIVYHVDHVVRHSKSRWIIKANIETTIAH